MADPKDGVALAGLTLAARAVFGLAAGIGITVVRAGRVVSVDTGSPRKQATTPGYLVPDQIMLALTAAAATGALCVDHASATPPHPPPQPAEHHRP